MLAVRWIIITTISVIIGFTNTQVLTITAIPLVNGDLTPILEAHYVVDGVAQTQLVVGDAAVHVETVEMYVDAGVIVEQGTVQEEDRLSVQVWIRNRSPFTLMLVDVRGNGADLAWEDSISSSTIAASDMFNGVLTATVTGPHPRPQLSTWYTWTDKSGTIYTRTLHLEGKEVAITDDILDRIPDELFGMIVGLIAGVLSTFLGGWVKDYLAQMSQKRVNQQHVQGLLEMVTRNSEYAANSGEKVALEPLDTIFQEEGLFTVLQKYKLNTDVYNLWSTAKRHNDGLNAPGGAQRAQSLAESAKKVRILLQTMRNR